MFRTARLVTAVLLLNACAHAPITAREPAATDARASLDGELRQVGDLYRREVVTAAYLMTEPDARGERRPLCAIDVAGRRDLVPGYLALDQTARDSSFGLPRCDANQTARIAELAANTARPNYAVAPLVAVGATCVFSFAYSAGLAIAATRVFNNKAHARTEAKHRKVRGAEAVGGAAGGLIFADLAAMATLRVPAAALFIGSGLVCAGLGTSVGYWLVPLQ